MAWQCIEEGVEAKGHERVLALQERLERAGRLLPALNLLSESTLEEAAFRTPASMNPVPEDVPMNTDRSVNNAA